MGRLVCGIFTEDGYLNIWQMENHNYQMEGAPQHSLRECRDAFTTPTLSSLVPCGEDAEAPAYALKIH